MKIDSKIQFTDDLQSGRVNAKRTTATASKPASQTTGVSSPAGEDTVSLSGAHGEIARLSAAAQQVPEVRTERIGTLKQQLRSGQFSPDAAKIADALIAEQSKTAKA
jgi:flagellar biosynthesis anti-sigma factor FlgM